MLKNKRGMLGSMIGGLVILLVLVAISGQIMQEVNNAINCNQTNTNITYEQPIGSTDSFGGGGSAHFGGYDGTVKKSWGSNLAIIKTNSSIINPDCIELGEASNTLLGIVPLFFLIIIVFCVLGLVYSAFNRSDYL